MSEKRRALGRGLGALIPSTPPGDNGSRPVDVFFKDNSADRMRPSVFGPVTRDGADGDVSRETVVRRQAQPQDSDEAAVSRETLADHGTPVDDAQDSPVEDEAVSLHQTTPHGGGDHAKDVSRETVDAD